MKLTRVLLIEDSHFFIQLVKSLLPEASHGVFDLECAESLAQGIDRLDKGGVDAVLLDLTLPDSDGLDTFQQVHQVAGRVPIVIFTSLDDEELSLTTLELGAADYLVKSEVNANWIARSLLYAVQRKRAEEKAQHSGRQQSRQSILRLEDSTAVGRPLVGRWLVKRLVGMVALEQAKRQVFKLLDQQRGRRLLLDFSDVEYVSNAAISTLLLVHKKSSSRGNQLILCNVSPQVCEHFSSRRFDSVFNIRRESVEDVAQQDGRVEK